MLNSNIVFIDNIETEEQAQMLNERLLNMIGVHTVSIDIGRNMVNNMKIV